jgi:hypothetical protein
MKTLITSEKVFFIKNLKVCRFSLEALMIKDRKMYAIEFIPGL